MRQAHKRGFTIIELLVVIAIIATLTSIAVVALGSARKKARDAKRVADVKAIQNAMELYYQDSNGYPVEDTEVELGVDVRTLCDTGFEDVPCTGAEYMGLIPTAPIPYDGDCDADTNKYMYIAPADSTYTITFCLGDNFGDYTSGIKTATEDGIQ